jgi:hypothetical protein
MNAYRLIQREQGGFPVLLAAVGGCDLSVLRVGEENYHWLVRHEGRVAEGVAHSADDARRQAEAVALAQRLP